MDSRERIRDTISRYIPFKVFALLVYMVWFGWMLLSIIALPLGLLYLLTLSVVAWFVLPKQGKEFIVVSNGKLPDEPLMIEINRFSRK